MNGGAEIFNRLVQAVLARFFTQTGRPMPAPEVLQEFGCRLWALIGERGLPPELAPQEQGEPGEMSAEEVAPLIARLVEGFSAEVAAAVATPARQLVKACFHPHFKVCRDSFREVTADGVCRRQQLAKVRERVSGSHCVDCPYWTGLTPAQHEAFLARCWQAGDAAELVLHREVYLPEDFRALRVFLAGGE
ncbi:MAG TPA: hypothetical protein PKY38_07815 [Opitutaceae bacterium]|nr:hypothetical protein [Opitutaceae bacterium]